MTNRSSAPTDRKSDNRGDPALTKWFYGFDSWSVLGPVLPHKLEMAGVLTCMVLTMKYGAICVTVTRK